MRAASFVLLLAGLVAGAPLGAQAPKAAPAGAAQAKAPAKAPAVGRAAADTLKLIFDREVYTYPGTARRDPFTPLTGKNDSGPRFEDLSIRGIIYVNGGDSLVLLSDGKKVYRRHRGEMVGNARVVAIEPTRVIFAVDNFGTWRQESLDLKKNPEGDKG